MKFFVFIVELFCMVSFSKGFSTPVPYDSFDSVTEFPVNDEILTSDEACVCQINGPKSIQCPSNPETVQGIGQLRIKIPQASLQVDQKIAHIDSLGSQIRTLTSTMRTTFNRLEQIESGSVGVSHSEFEVLRLEITDMEALLLILKQNQTLCKAEGVSLEKEIASIAEGVNSLEEIELTNSSQLISQIKDFKQQLLDCRENLDNGGNSLETWYSPEDQLETCHKVKSVSPPYIIRSHAYSRATWFRDPIKDQQKVYVFYCYSSNRYYNYVEIYPTVTQFSDAKTPTKLRIGSYAQGTGMVAYNGSLFFHVYNGLYMGKYDIERGRFTRALLPSDTLYNGNGDYLSRTYTDVDFAVDESGLWVIYSRSSSKEKMVISKVDPDTLALTNTWTTDVRKSTKGNCFVICQVLYCTDSFNTRSDKIRYYFDTKTSTGGFLDVPVSIESRFRATYALSYNPYDEKLYGWDNYHPVVYGVSFESNE